MAMDSGFPNQPPIPPSPRVSGFAGFGRAGIGRQTGAQMEYKVVAESLNYGVWAFAGDGEIEAEPAELESAAREWLLAGEWSGCDAARVTVDDGTIVVVTREDGGWSTDDDA